MLKIQVFFITPHISSSQCYYIAHQVSFSTKSLHYPPNSSPPNSPAPSKSPAPLRNGEFKQHPVGSDPRLPGNVSHRIPTRGSYSLPSTSFHWIFAYRRDDFQVRPLSTDRRQPTRRDVYDRAARAVAAAQSTSETSAKDRPSHKGGYVRACPEARYHGSTSSRLACP